MAEPSEPFLHQLRTPQYQILMIKLDPLKPACGRETFNDHWECEVKLFPKLSNPQGF